MRELLQGNLLSNNKKHMNKLLTIFFIIILSKQSFSQVKDSSINILQVEVNYSFCIPGGNLADRFGVNSTIGAGLTYKLKSNWTIGAEISYLFGSNVKEDSILNHLRVQSGVIVNKYGEGAKEWVTMAERGFYACLKFGKLIPVTKYNDNSGLIVSAGFGILQHKIHIENKDNNVPPVINDYKKGYDRLTNGFSLKEFVGYQHLSNNGYFNFYGGFEFYQSWTQCRRAFNFDTMQKDETKRKDFMYGIRIGWILPLYKKTPDKYYYY